MFRFLQMMAVIATGFCLLSTAATSATVNELQAMNLGTWTIKTNSGVESITVNPNGTYNGTSGLIMLSPPQHGIYDIGDLPVSTLIVSVDVVQIQALDAGAGPEWQMDNFQVTAPASTDSGGHATVSVGVRANTSGNGTAYPDATYDGDLELTFNF